MGNFKVYTTFNEQQEPQKLEEPNKNRNKIVGRS